MSRVVVVGAGILGLATAKGLTERGDDVVVVEKERHPAAHQTGRNSGVVHAGLYYPPGSMKATMAVAGSRSIQAYARAKGVAVENCGKLVVAVDAREEVQLRKLADRAVRNGVPARLVGPAEARDYEPYVRCVAALRVESTSIIDYRGVCDALAEDCRAAGAELRFGSVVEAIEDDGARVRVTTESGDITADALVACAGLYADKIAELAGIVPEARIVPFRGEYFHLTPEREYLVNGLIYPVPDPRFPFLGVHLTRMVGGGVHLGPNAVLALQREGYRWRDVNLSELRESLSWPGLWQLARRNVGPGSREVARSFSRHLFARSVSRLVPGIEAGDLRPSPAGVRAQALRRDGSMVEDFLVQTTARQVHVINAPSPAATASLEIAGHVIDELDRSFGR